MHSNEPNIESRLPISINQLVNGCTAALLVVNDKGIVCSANQTIQEILGYTPTEIIDKPVTCLMPSEYGLEHDKFLQRFLAADNASGRAMGGGKTFPAIHKSGKEIEIYIGLKQVNNEGKKFIVATLSHAFLGGDAYVDNNESNLNQQRIYENKRLIQLVEASPDGILLIDKQKTVVWANKSYLNMLSSKGTQLIGLKIQHILSSLGVAPDIFSEVIKNNEIVSFPLTVTVDDQIKHITLTISPIMSYLDVQGTLLTFSDVTERFLMQQEITEKKSFLESVTKIAKIGYWSVDIKTGKMFWSDEVYRIHELPVGSEINLELGVSFYTDESRPIIEKAIERSMEDGTPWDYELPFKTAKGRDIWVRAVGVAEVNSEGTPVMLKGGFQDITHLRESARKAEEGIRAKSQFLANMSHELRTPLTGIKGIAELLHDSPLNEKQKYLLESLQYSADTLLSLVNQVLFFAKYEAKADSIIESEINLVAFLQKMTFSHKLTAEKKGLAFNFAVAEDVPKIVIMDRGKLEQVLNNLLSNANKFTEQGETKLLVQINSENQLVMSVIDTGTGIKEEDFDVLFDAFRQVDMSFSRRYQGTGLGLTITKDLVEKMGGKIQVTSEFGKGSRFDCYFPLKTVEKNSGNMLGTQEKSSELKEKAAYSVNPLKNKHILVVEDNEVNQILFEECLMTTGAHISVANNGVHALEIISENKKFDCIIMDCQMPEMDGYECSEAIRALKDQHYRNVPIIAATAHVFKDERNKCFDAGMNDIIEKPFDREILIEKILSYI
ncbi:response regulator [Glaciecola sp. 1036]|uniref:response regulator n=1 Tax=Alteromonadaceae TaxID=72275 RepID=UPI003D07712F